VDAIPVYVMRDVIPVVRNMKYTDKLWFLILVYVAVLFLGASQKIFSADKNTLLPAGTKCLFSSHPFFASWPMAPINGQ